MASRVWPTISRAEYPMSSSACPDQSMITPLASATTIAALRRPMLRMIRRPSGVRAQLPGRSVNSWPVQIAGNQPATTRSRVASEAAR
jgi:hypothetical protein